MLAQRISSINSIAAVCDATGADVDEVAETIGADPRIGSKFLKAGIGFGGSCFKKDVLSLVYLAETLGLPEVANYWRAVTDMNEFARTRFTSRVISCLNNTLSGKKLTVLGYAFKKDTNDTRESPALHIVQTLLEEGPKELAVFDPLCNPEQIADEIHRLAGPDVLQRHGGPVVIYTDVYAACRGSDAVLITTEFDEFRNVSMEAKVATSMPDPRPFDRDEPNESDLLSLHAYLLQSQTAGAPTSGDSMPNAKDPLGRFQPMPSCPEDCPDCHTEKVMGEAGSGTSMKHGPKRRLDWRKIYYHMNRPQWVFDGRGVLDIAAMEKIGFRVESVGRQSRVSYQ
jgi:UDPglucose 6-dehydrogenase